MAKVVIGEILPLALVVTISPLNIIPAILLLFTDKPLARGLTFVAGFILGVAVALVAFIAIADAANLSGQSGHSSWGGVVKVVLGAYLLVAAVRKFRGRPASGQPGSMPAWMDGIAGYSEGKALGAGLVLGAANPKNVVVGLAAAVAIVSGGLSTGQRLAVGSVYVLVAVLGVAAPLVVMVLLGDRASEVLETWNQWLRQNSATVMSVLFVVFGVVLIGQGIAASEPVRHRDPHQGRLSTAG